MNDATSLEAAFRQWWSEQGWAAKPNPHTINIAVAFALWLESQSAEPLTPSQAVLQTYKIAMEAAAPCVVSAVLMAAATQCTEDKQMLLSMADELSGVEVEEPA